MRIYKKVIDLLKEARRGLSWEVVTIELRFKRAIGI